MLQVNLYSNSRVSLASHWLLNLLADIITIFVFGEMSLRLTDADLSVFDRPYEKWPMQ